MSMHLYGYVGAFARVPLVENQKTLKVYRCSDKNCSNHTKMSESNVFCPKCGSKGEKHTETIKEEGQLNWFQFTEEHFSDPDIFWCNEEGIIMPNRKFGSTASFSREDGTMTKTINDKKMKKAIEEFKEKFQPFADKIKEIYNKDVQVEYGLVTYYM